MFKYNLLYKKLKLALEWWFSTIKQRDNFKLKLPLKGWFSTIKRKDNNFCLRDLRNIYVINSDKMSHHQLTCSSIQKKKKNYGTPLCDAHDNLNCSSWISSTFIA